MLLMPVGGIFMVAPVFIVVATVPRVMIVVIAIVVIVRLNVCNATRNTQPAGCNQTQ